MSLSYNAAAGDPMKTYSPTTGDDVTSLLQNLPALPSLRAARITAFRRSVGPVDMCCLSHLGHLAIACKNFELNSVAADSAGGWDLSMSPNTSLHIIAERASPQTVGSRACAFSVDSSSSWRAHAVTHSPLLWLECALAMQVDILQRMKAQLSTLWTGELYMTKRLQQWKAGPPHPLDLHPRTAMATMETVYDGGFFL